MTDDPNGWFDPPRIRRQKFNAPTSTPVGKRPERGGALQALSRETLIGRSLEMSSSTFTTIVSIVQGVGLAILADRTFKNPSPLVLAQSLALLLVFVCFFYIYVNVTIMLRWAPSFLDSLLPFALAGLEIPPAYFLGNVRAWNSLLAVLWLGAAGMFFITIKWSPPSHFGEERAAYAIFRHWSKEVVAASAAGATLMGFFGLFAYRFPVAGLWWGAAGVGATLATIATLVGRSEIRSSQIHAYFGVDRPPFN